VKEMINMEKAKKEFIAYTNQFDINNPNIERKIGHSIRVMGISKKIAESLKLDKEQIELAALIGLLHDIGRFNQMKKYNTFNDKDSIDHGDYGIEILNKDMRKYIDSNKYDTIIKKAIKNHNKYEIEEGLTDEELLFSKIIRDADKTDILYEAVCIFWKDSESKIEKEIISDHLFNQFKNRTLIKRTKGKKSGVDSILTTLAFIFDINFKSTFEILSKEEYINKIIERFDFKDEYTKEKMEEVKEIANKYIQEKTKKE
jgi:putative nucleotidyltransferase with HDIG domain